VAICRIPGIPHASSQSASRRLDPDPSVAIEHLECPLGPTATRVRCFEDDFAADLCDQVRRGGYCRSTPAIAASNLQAAVSLEHITRLSPRAFLVCEGYLTFAGWYKTDESCDKP